MSSLDQRCDRDRLAATCLAIRVCWHTIHRRRSSRAGWSVRLVDVPTATCTLLPTEGQDDVREARLGVHPLIPPGCGARVARMSRRSWSPGSAGLQENYCQSPWRVSMDVFEERGDEGLALLAGELVTGLV